MKIALALAALLTFGSISHPLTDASFPVSSTTVMSYNIDSEDSDSEIKWDARRSIVAQIIRSKKPEILGIQEATLSQTTWLSNEVKGYSWYASGSKEKDYQEEMCPIFYMTDKFNVLANGSFRLPSSTGASDESAKAVNWIELNHLSSKKKLFVFNTQFLQGDTECQNNSAHLLKNRVDGIVNGESFVILGDLNCEPENEPVSWMTTWTKDSHESCLVNTTKATKTFLGWKRDNAKAKRLDYILLSKDIPTNSHEVVDLNNNGNYPSDHLPVYCRLRFQ